MLPLCYLVTFSFSLFAKLNNETALPRHATNRPYASDIPSDIHCKTESIAWHCR
ncbi:hypothetical protein Poly59_44640 [Rubripirellula reticaptiva]|uniref:Uncharacterized protein n=1 Tax=Rubripirellula reticaptiva TaxID=2528013 RepID=A0A5C6EQZ7_9BACT|nr:hypothetical protein Poly59_44640 [Rubripirellula reticaptiva]